MSQKVVVLGLDGGTFRLIKPFVRQGVMPNIGKFLSKGTHRILRSTIPPVSPPAWSTFLTGTNPGGHGIFQFVEMDVKDYSFSRNRLINSTLYSGKTFIDFISKSGLKVGVVKIPFTYPPWPVNGVMIAGEPSPDWEKAHTYPPELAETLGRVNQGSAADFLRYNTEELLDHLKFDCRIRTQLTLDLMKKDEYDFFMMVHNITDAAIHRFWKFTDETCPNYKPEFEKHKDIIKEVYKAADESVGKILDSIDEDTTVLMMSDHGAARKPIYFFHINAWLKEGGYLKVNESHSPVQYLFSLMAWLKGKTPPLLRQLVMRILKSYFQNRMSQFQTRAANLKWEETKAYAVNLYSCIDGIAVNMKGRQEQGIVEPGEETEKICRRIETDLADIRDPFTGAKIIRRIYRRHEVFQGSFADKMPELIVEYNLDYRSGKQTGLPLVTKVPKTDFDFQSGDHDPDGIFIAAGPNINSGEELPPAPIQDMAPTILHLMGLPVPENMDGSVMTDIFNKAFAEQNTVSKVSDKDFVSGEVMTLSQEDEEEMKKQLEGLGYM